ncbi:GNAT family N-acetyltransferase, partial [Pseudonocardia sp.]|uniref:GNAT family N-acetyltransferase n=1 Tax=Pseudonocardia sp. TaxID=60912 RepID=UPI0031FE2EAB
WSVGGAPSSWGWSPTRSPGGSGAYLLPVYYRLHFTSVERWAEKQHDSRVLARWRAHRRDPLEKFEAKSKHLSEAFRMCVAFVGDRPTAAVIVLFGRTARYIRGAMDRDLAGPSRANAVLHLAAIEQACLEGCSTDHLGEPGASASLARFRERFGAVPVNNSEYRIGRFPITAVDSAVRSAVKTVLRFWDA